MDFLYQGLTHLPIIIYLVVQIVRDFRRRNFVIAGIGAFCIVWIFMIIPIPTHAVAIPLIPPQVR